MKFIESICYSKGGYQNLEFHQERVNRTFSSFYSNEPHRLNTLLPKIEDESKMKVRILYDEEGVDIEYAQYEKRNVKTLEVVESGPFDYQFKFENRDRINDLFQYSKSDDIIISIDGNITDSSYSNLAFFDGEQWFTPDTPLLNGTKRELLLTTKKLTTMTLRKDDLHSFEKVSLINAMLDLGEIEVPVENIKFGIRK